ncbi:class I SAM-dependent methyltransferase [Amycolatopsis japonica]|uniref:class I SAM-dependent methyltransferase n=1 Tax=Amycolatopsis japonica TaxID=208439 RepID=UPI003670ED48
MVENDYDTFAEAYAAENETSLINAYYTRPAILDLAGDVTGRRILDAGCGAGPLFEALRDRGAIVSGFDSSAKMLELARNRLGDDAALRVADIGEPLPYPDGAFDDVIAALVLHYLEDWTAPLAEIRRVLKPGGRLIMAVNHPIIFKLVHPEGDYFKTVKWSDEYAFSGQKAVLTYWHRPLHAMTDAFTAAGFRTSVVSEPHPAPGARERFPEELAGKTAFLSFLFFVLEADQEVGCQASATRSTALRAGSRAAWS